VQKYLSLFILLLLFSCAPVTEQQERPDSILPEEKMVNILSDMHLAEALVNATPHGGDTNTHRIIDYYGAIYTKYDVTKEVFQSSYDYYVYHPVLLDSVYSKIIIKLSDKETRLRGK
jgi:hypothetical protein